MSGTLAQTIQGEAGSDPAAQFAVAATIWNRMHAGTFPGGTDPTAIVNAPEQYVGIAGTPNATATAFAEAIQNGTLTSYGNPGNATDFQSGQTAARNGFTAGGANIGGNWFSDVFGSPSANFVPPSYAGLGIAQGPDNTSSGIAAGSGAGSVWGDIAGAVGGMLVPGGPAVSSAIGGAAGAGIGAAAGAGTQAGLSIGQFLAQLLGLIPRALVVIVGLAVAALGLWALLSPAQKQTVINLPRVAGEALAAA